MNEEPKASIGDDFLPEDFEIQQEELETFIEDIWVRYLYRSSYNNNS